MPSFSELLQSVQAALSASDKPKAIAVLKVLSSLPVAAARDLNEIGLCHSRLGQFEEAAKFYEKATRADPRQIWYPNNWGLALFKAGRIHDAEKVFHDALLKNPDAAMTHLNLGVLYESEGRAKEALVRFREAVRLKPTAAAFCSLGTVHDVLGNAEEARVNAEAALDLDPEHANAAWLLTGLLRRAKKPAEALTRAEKTLTRFPDHVGLLYETGHVLHDLKRYDEAFAHFQKANSLQDRKTVTRERYLSESESIRSFLVRIDASASAPQISRATSGPIFLVGSPRSGTTLLATMLGMHSKIKNAGELETVPQTYQEANRLLDSPNDVGKILASVWHPNNAALPPLLAKHYQTLLAAVPTDGKPFLLDKLPSNARRLGFISRIAPGAPVIHIIRDGREVAFSAFTQNFRKDTWHSHELTDALVEWETTVRLARLGARALKLPYHEVFYEKLVEDPRGILNEVLEFLGCDWEDACLNYDQSGTPANTASFHQVRQKLYKSSIGKAKNYPEQYELMTKAAEGMLKELGYI